MSRFCFWLAVTALFAAIPLTCRAEQQCPWMNAATAGGFLGGEVQTKVTSVNEDGDATCEFTLPASSGASSMLRIAVHTMTHMPQDFQAHTAQCSKSSVVLRGIGNEALQCLPTSGESKGEELIVGRVRNRAFAITIRADWIRRPRSSPTKTRNPISDDSENIAEQVAGSMF